MANILARRLLLPFAPVLGLGAAWIFLHLEAPLSALTQTKTGWLVLLLAGPIAAAVTVITTILLEPKFKVRVALIATMIWSVLAHNLAFGLIFDTHKANPEISSMMINAAGIALPSILTGFAVIAVYYLLVRASMKGPAR